MIAMLIAMFLYSLSAIATMSTHLCFNVYWNDTPASGTGYTHNIHIEQDDCGYE
jgi:hypothetical protein